MNEDDEMTDPSETDHDHEWWTTTWGVNVAHDARGVPTEVTGFQFGLTCVCGDEMDVDVSLQDLIDDRLRDLGVIE